MSIDGKVQKGRLAFEKKNGYPIHAASVVDHQTGIVLTQGHVQKNDIASPDEATESEPTSKLTAAKEKEQQEEKKQKSELAVASRLIEDIDWKGKVLTGDALELPEVFVLGPSSGGGRLFVSGERKPAALAARFTGALCSSDCGETSRRRGLAIT